MYHCLLSWTEFQRRRSRERSAPRGRGMKNSSNMCWMCCYTLRAKDQNTLEVWKAAVKASRFWASLQGSSFVILKVQDRVFKLGSLSQQFPFKTLVQRSLLERKSSLIRPVLLHPCDYLHKIGWCVTLCLDCSLACLDWDTVAQSV